MVVVFKALSLLTEGTVNGLLCERAGLSRVRRCEKKPKWWNQALGRDRTNRKGVIGEGSSWYLLQSLMFRLSRVLLLCSSNSR